WRRVLPYTSNPVPSALAPLNSPAPPIPHAYPALLPSALSTENRANVRGNRLTMHGDCHYEYDEFGNLTEERRGKGQKLVTRYSYDCEHRLTSVTKPDGSTWHYEYDAFGRRIAKTNALTRTEFLWQGDRLIAEETGDRYRTYIYEPDSFKPLALVDGYGPEQARIYYYHLDHLGTPQELTNAQGDLVWSVTYRAYGNVVRALVQEIDNPLRFQGQYYDSETGLHYNRHRYYNPNTGRFQTPDPIGLAGGLNNYQYVPNPTGWVDPLELASQKTNCPESGSKVPDNIRYEKYWDDLVQTPASLSNRETRAWYLSKEMEIPNLIDTSKLLEYQANQAFEIRNDLRTGARDLMADQKVADYLRMNEPNLTWDELVTIKSMKYSGDDLWNSIIHSSQKSRESVNAQFNFIGDRLRYD